MSIKLPAPLQTFANGDLVCPGSDKAPVVGTVYKTALAWLGDCPACGKALPTRDDGLIMWHR